MFEFGEPHNRVTLFAPVGALTLKIAEEAPPQQPAMLNQWEFVSVEPHGSQPKGSEGFAPVCGEEVFPVTPPNVTPPTIRAPDISGRTWDPVLRVVVAEAGPDVTPITATNAANPTKTDFNGCSPEMSRATVERYTNEDTTSIVTV